MTESDAAAAGRPGVPRSLSATRIRRRQRCSSAVPASVDSLDLLVYARSCGCSYFDTAPLLRPRPVRALLRRRATPATRATNSCCRPRSAGMLRPAPRRSTRPIACRSTSSYDYSYDAVMRSIDDSLQRLGLARIDIAYIHDVNPRWHGERTSGASARRWTAPTALWSGCAAKARCARSARE